MRSLYEQGYAVQYIARRFNCRSNAVWNRVFDLSAPRHLSPGERKRAAASKKFTAREVKAIRRRAISEGVSSAALAQEYGVSQACTLGIIRGKTYRWVAGWIRPSRNGPLVKLVPGDYPEHPQKTDLKRGFKAGVSVRSVPHGTLVRLSKMTGLSKSTLSRMLRK